VPGHWEGDLIIGKDCKSAVGTLVERTTRYVLLLHLPEGRGAEGAGAAMRRAIATLPGALRTVTWDQGKEMAFHARFAIATGIQVYFCDPHKPWQRGSNENTTGLLHQKVRVAAHPRAREDQSTAADPGGDVARPIGPTSGRAAGRRNTGIPGSCGPGRRRTKSMTC